MNAIILSAVWGVVMMFTGVFIKSKTAPKYMAVMGLAGVLIANLLQEFKGINFFTFPIQDMLRADSFNLLFVTIMLATTLIYFLLNAKLVLRTHGSFADSITSLLRYKQNFQLQNLLTK